MKRNLKIYYTYNKEKIYPLIMLKGAWLEKLEFQVGDKIEVECKKNKIVIKKSPV